MSKCWSSPSNITLSTACVSLCLSHTRTVFPCAGIPALPVILRDALLPHHLLSVLLGFDMRLEVVVVVRLEVGVDSVRGDDLVRFPATPACRRIHTLIHGADGFRDLSTVTTPVLVQRHHCTVAAPPPFAFPPCGPRAAPNT